FPIENGDGSLTPWFVTVSNIESRDPKQVRAGNERVVRPRLADAAFFWDQDRKQPLDARREGLDKVTFQARLGSLGGKTRLVSALAGEIAAALDAGNATAQTELTPRQSASDPTSTSGPASLAIEGFPSTAVSRRAAELCKCDLLTAMVGEFPELQGIMG